MKKLRLDSMKGGWFVGNFKPTVLDTKDYEVGIKIFTKGTVEKRHVHKIAYEISVLVEGHVRMDGHTMNTGDIILLEPGEPSDFEALSDGLMVVVKSPSIPGDKYIIDGT